MKTRRKSGLLVCFRPVAVDGDLISGKSSHGKSVFTYISVADDDLIPEILPPKPENLVVPEDEPIVRQRRRRRIFDRIVKAMVFEIVPAKVRNGKVLQDPIRSSICFEKVSDSPDEKTGRRPSEEDDRKISAIFSSSAASNSSFSSSTSFDSASSIESKTSKPLSRRKKSPLSNSGDSKQSIRKPGPRSYDSATGLYLMILTLSIMVFWGRICAILWTSTWLYFLLRRESDVNRSPEIDEPPENSINRPEIEWREEKKRVIMEGLLERNHHKSTNTV